MLMSYQMEIYWNSLITSIDEWMIKNFESSLINTLMVLYQSKINHIRLQSDLKDF